MSLKSYSILSPRIKTYIHINDLKDLISDFKKVLSLIEYNFSINDFQFSCSGSSNVQI